MMVDDDGCYRAMQRRDARFDGVFFTAVRTTGIYCRPVCPAPQPKRENCTFYPSAAAAEEAGYRACRRCRPETAPGSPAWLGVGATLARALRLIEAGALDRDGVDAVAGRLGVGARHLRRLFTDHLGASPMAIARTHRLHLARRLTETTSLPLGEVAAAAGFGSVRRFNDAFAKAFKHPPGALRPAKMSLDTDEACSEGMRAAPFDVSLTLATRPPFDALHLCRFLSARAIPGVEIGDGVHYGRVLGSEAGPALILARAQADGPGLDVRFHLSGAAGLRAAIAQTRHIFDLDTDSGAVDMALARDPDLARRVEAHPGIRVPGGADVFEFAVRAVIGQQISVKGARTITGRLVERTGKALPPGLAGLVPGLTRGFPAPADIVDADLNGLGLTTRRVETLRGLAQAFLAADPGLPDLAALRGIGPWTLQYIAMRALGDPDAFPEKDLGLLKALGLGPSSGDAKHLMERAEAWRPYRAYAAIRLWHSLEADQ